MSTSSDQTHGSAPVPEAAAGGVEPDDGALVARAQKGDTEAFTTLVERHEVQLYRLALRMMGNETEAEEVLQDALLNAFEKIGAFRGEAAFNSWVYRITANTALMRLRRRRRSPEVSEQTAGPSLEAALFGSDGAYLEPPRSDWSLRADDALYNRQLGAAIEEAVANLSDDYRVVFLLKDVDGLSNEQIAESLGLSVPAVKSRLHRARLVLREQLGELFHGG